MRSLKRIKNNLLAEYIEELELAVSELAAENVALLERLPDYPEIDKAELEREVDAGLGLPTPPTGSATSSVKIKQ